jgi:hypothetical protein
MPDCHNLSTIARPIVPGFGIGSVLAMLDMFVNGHFGELGADLRREQWGLTLPAGRRFGAKLGCCGSAVEMRYF